MEDLTGKILGQYQITGPLGEGGMAAVYKAYQPGMDRYVALKILPRHFAHDPQFVKRFQQEAKIIAKLQHPHILPVYDYGESDGYTFIVMPFIQSGTLADLLHGKPLPITEIRQVISQVGDALDYAHSQGVVHRDIKPSNILIDERGNCLLTDFGIGKILAGSTQITRTGDVIGTPIYMSPEQGLGDKIDHRSDIYSLGVMLYEMATGRQPFGAETPMAILIKHIHDPLPPPRSVNPAIAEPLERVILKALAKKREHRFSTAGEMVRALQTAFETVQIPKVVPAPVVQAGPVPSKTGVPAGARPPSTGVPRVRPRPRVNPAWIVAGVGGLGMIGILVIIGVIYMLNRFWGGSPSGETPPIGDGQSSLMENNQGPTSPSMLNPIELPFSMPAEMAAYVYDARGLEVIAPAVVWSDQPEFVGDSQADILEDPKGEFEQVAILSVRGYGHGEQTTSLTVKLEVPEDADIVSIPVATALNGTVNDTDSESGLEIVVRDPNTGKESWTYAANLMETRLGVPYVFAFADVSPFRGQTAELTITLRQADVCAGAQCTHDADFYFGDLYFGLLPDICTTQADRTYTLYDYYNDPTPKSVTACENPQAYYFMDIEDGPYFEYGNGHNEYKVHFALPENAQLVEFHLFYGYYTQGLKVNNHLLSPEKVYEAFPIHSGTSLNIAEPGRYSLFNDNPEVVASFFNWGTNDIEMTVYADESWEERTFDMFVRFKVPVTLK